MVFEPNLLADEVSKQAYNRKIAEKLGYFVFIEVVDGKPVSKMYKDRDILPLPNYQHNLHDAMSLPFGKNLRSLKVECMRRDGIVLAEVTYEPIDDLPGNYFRARVPGDPAFAVCELWLSMR